MIMHLFGFSAKHLRYSPFLLCLHSELCTLGWRFRDCCNSLSRVKTTISDLKLRFNNYIVVRLIMNINIRRTMPKNWFALHTVGRCASQLIFSSEPYSAHFLVRATSKCSSFNFPSLNVLGSFV